MSYSHGSGLVPSLFHTLRRGLWLTRPYDTTAVVGGNPKDRSTGQPRVLYHGIRKPSPVPRIPNPLEVGE